MAVSARIHGKSGLIYLSGAELFRASVVTITQTTDSEEGPEFGDGYPSRAVGLMHWGGSISAWYSHSDNYLWDCAENGWAVVLLAYPNREAQSNFFSGNVILSFEHSQDVASLAAQTASFVGDGVLNCSIPK